MKNSWVFPATALAIGAIGGFLAGQNTSPPADPGKPETSLTRVRSQSRNETTGSESRRTSRIRSTDEAYRTPGQSNRIQTLMDFYAGLTPEQLEAEAAKLEDLPMSERIIASFLLFAKWAETDPTAAMAYTGKMGMTGNFVRPTVLQSWAGTDPEGAAKYYSENPREFAMMGMMGGGRGGMSGGGASVIAGEWAKQDPAAAMAWATSLSGNDKGSAMTGVVREVANSDPAKAWNMVGSMDEDSQSRAYREIAAKWGATDFSEAERQIATLPADQQAKAMSAAVEGLAKSDPKQALAKLSSIPAGESRDSATRAVVESMSRDNARDAAAWVLASADESAKGEALQAVMPNYVSQDPGGALELVNKLPAGEIRDDAASSYVFNNRTAPPAELMKVAETITDEQSRTRTQTVTAMRWMAEDSKAANAYIQSSDSFSEEAKARAAEGQPLWGGGRGGRGPGGGR